MNAIMLINETIQEKNGAGNNEAGENERENKDQLLSQIFSLSPIFSLY